LGPKGIPQNDLSTLLQRAEVWSGADRENLVSLFGSAPCHAPLLLLAVRGSLEPGGVKQAAVLVAALTCTGEAVHVEAKETTPTAGAS
jgi:hypothetical protein